MRKELAEHNVYIDTSAIIPFYFKEIYSSESQRLFEEHSFFQISELSKIEFYSTARKKVRLGHTTESEIKKVFRFFELHLKEGVFSILNVNKPHYEAASNIIKSTENSLRSLDALHLGIAYSENLSIFSFDKVFIKTAEEFGIRTIGNY